MEGYKAQAKWKAEIEKKQRYWSRCRDQKKASTTYQRQKFIDDHDDFQYLPEHVQEAFVNYQGNKEQTKFPDSVHGMHLIMNEARVYYNRMRG